MTWTARASRTPTSPIAKISTIIKGWGPAINLGPGINSTESENFGVWIVERGDDGEHRDGEEEGDGDQEARAQMVFGRRWDPQGAGDKNSALSFDLFQSTRDRHGVWGLATPITELNTVGEDLSPSLTRDGLTMYFSSNRSGPLSTVTRDLYVTKRRTWHDTWEAPVVMGSPPNSPFAETHPSISWDNKTLHFSSARPGGFGTNDLYVMTDCGTGSPRP